MLSWILPVMLFFAIWVFVIRKLGNKQGLGGFMSVGKSKAKVYVESDTKVTFDDVAGVDAAKAALLEIVAFLNHPQSRSEERRVGKERDNQCRSRWSPYHS